MVLQCRIHYFHKEIVENYLFLSLLLFLKWTLQVYLQDEDYFYLKQNHLRCHKEAVLTTRF